MCLSPPNLHLDLHLTLVHPATHLDDVVGDQWQVRQRSAAGPLTLSLPLLGRAAVREQPQESLVVQAAAVGALERDRPYAGSKRSDPGQMLWQQAQAKQSRAVARSQLRQSADALTLR